MATLQELLALGRDMGLTEAALTEFVSQQQAVNREERQRERDHTRGAEEETAKGKQLQQEIELVRLRAETAELEHRRKLELLAAEGERGVGQGGDRGPGNWHGPKIPPFDDGRDSIDAYLRRFEMYATAQKWPDTQWAVHLSALLKGKSLEVYSRLAVSQAVDYPGLKQALLKRFDFTEEGFRKLFREGKVEKSETFLQFSVRLENYLTRWVEMANIGKTYDEFHDLIMREQFLQSCNVELGLFLRERKPDKLEAMARYADQFIEAREMPASNFSQKPAGSRGKPYQGPQGGKPQCRGQDSLQRKSETPVSNSSRSRNGTDRRCFICDKKDHLANKCPERIASKGRVGAVESSNAGKEPGHKVQQTREVVMDGAEVYSGGVIKHLPGNMPVCQGWIADKRVSILRDTGCGGVVVRRALIPENSFSGAKKKCLLADGSNIEVSIATVEIDSPYLVGTVECWGMENPIYDVIVGNVEGAREPSDPDNTWFRQTIQAVQTRGRAKQQGSISHPRLKVLPMVGRDIKPEEMKKAQEDDTTLDAPRQHANEGGTRTHGKYAESKFYYKGGLLYRKYVLTQKGEEVNQLVVPKLYRHCVLELAHESVMGGHMGARKTSQKILAEFFWPGIQGEAKRYCQSCDACQRTIPKGRVAPVPLGRMPVIGTPFERVAVDIVGPLTPRTDKGNRYILTLVDFATRYPEAVPLPGIETEQVAEALLDMFSRVGVPREILSDRGSQFTSDMMKEVCRLMSLKQIMTTPYHPQCNGLCEKFNGTLKQMLKRTCAERPRDWDKYVNPLLFAYREVPQTSLGFSPFELIYGRTVRGPLRILKELWTKDIVDPEVKTTYQYLIDLRDRLEKTCEMARENLRGAASEQRRYYNQKARIRNMEVGERVLVLLPTKTNKLLMQWKGPYHIVKKQSEMDYTLNMGGKLKTWHANMLKKYVEREAKLPERKGVLAVVGVAVIDLEEDGSSEEELMSVPRISGSETWRDVEITEDLSESQVVQVQDLLREYDHVFTDVPGRTDLVHHDIVTESNRPVKVKSYPLPFSTTEIVKEEVTKMLKMDIIELSDSPYAAPVVLVKKRDSSYRFCVDYRQINKVTVLDSEPMPNPEEMFSKLAGYRYFSKLDLSKGYWQVPMSSEAKHKTAFVCPAGLFQFKVMSFGLVNAPATFSRLMRILLRGMENTDNFLDDVLIFTHTWEGHLVVIRELLNRLSKANLTARPTKCGIGWTSIECLGHMVGEDRLQPLPSKIKAITEASRPLTKKEVRAFIGLAGFYRRFIPNFSTIALPLTDLTKKGQPNKVLWTDTQQNAFEQLKGKLASGPILKLPDMEKDFVLRTDASADGIGAILLQDEGGNLFPVAYASRKLVDRERRFSTVERECLAVVWGIDKFSRYLYGRAFDLETDHQPLIYLNKQKVSNARLMRWALLLQPYRIRIKAIRGTDNIGADFLSRSGTTTTSTIEKM